MVAIFWNTNGIALLHVLLKSVHMNSSIFTNEILSPLTNYPAYVETKKSRKKFYIHFDKARSHKAKKVNDFLAQKMITVLPHPEYSLDLDPSDFYLFWELKKDFEGVMFESEEE